MWKGLRDRKEEGDLNALWFEHSLPRETLGKTEFTDLQVVKEQDTRICNKRSFLVSAKNL